MPSGQDVEAIGLGLVVSSVVPRQLARRLDLTLPELARLAGVPRGKLTAQSAAPEAEVALRSIVHILALAAEMRGGYDQATVWFMHHPIIGFAGKTACDLVREGRADEVVTYLESVQAGVYA